MTQERQQNPSPIDSDDQDMVELLITLREEAIASGIDFCGAIVEPDGLPRVISHITPDTLNEIEEDAS